MSDSILLFFRYDDATVINIFVEFLKISTHLTLDMHDCSPPYCTVPARPATPSSRRAFFPATTQKSQCRATTSPSAGRGAENTTEYSDQSLVRSRNRICRRVCRPSLLHFLPIWKKTRPLLPECVNRRVIAKSSLKKGVTVVVDKLQRLISDFSFFAKRFSCSHVPPLPYDRI